MQVPPLHASVKSAVGRATGPVKVEFAGVVQSTWNFQTASSLGLAPRETRGLGAPNGGWRAPSRSAGTRPLKLLLGVEHCFLGPPAARRPAPVEAPNSAPAEVS